LWLGDNVVNPKSAKVVLLVCLLIVSSVPVTMLLAESDGPVPIYYMDQDLIARRTTTAPVVDGVVDPVWNNARILETRVSGNSGAIFMEMKAMFDDDYIYFLTSWDEPIFPETPNPDVERDAWEMLSNVTPGSWDHKDWGEDRISFFFEDPASPVIGFDDGGCDAICHDLNYMHTKNVGEQLDAWVWSSATTNPQGYADDGVLLNNNTVPIDPKTMHVNVSDLAWDAGNDGWYVNNDTDNSTERPSYVWKQGAAPADPRFMFMTDAEAVDWDTFDVSTIPNGMFIPGHVLMTPSGDRADVQAKGIHNGTGWNIEFKRLRDTGSADDVAFDRTNLAYFFGTAIANNRTGEDHSKGIHEYTLWLAEPVLPDLTISHYIPEGSSHTVNSTVTVGVYVENIGWADAGASRLSYWWENETGAVESTVWYADTDPVPWGETKHVEVEVNTSGLDPGNWTLNATADADGDITEIYETNNWLTYEFELGAEPLPNLKVTSIDMDPAELTQDGYTDITVTVENDGSADAPSSSIILFLEDPGSPIAEDTIAAIAMGGSTNYLFMWGPVNLPEGQYVLNVTVDPDNEIKEGNESDNTMGSPFNVSAPTLPDLVVESVQPINITVTQGDETLARVVVKNIGGATATTDFEVALFLDEAFSVGTIGLVANEVVTDDIPAGGNVTVLLTWTVPVDADVGADHFIRGEADWLKAVTELDDSNNNGTFDGLLVVRQDLPDLTIPQVVPASATVKLETRITFITTVKNQGNLASSTTTLEIKDLTHNRTLERLAVPGLEVNETVDIPFTWYVENIPVGSLELRFMVDPDDMINEDNEFNNAFNVNVEIEAAALPDLTYTEEDPVLFFPAEPRVGESVTISISIVNIGTNASEATILEVKLGNNVIATANVLALGVGEQRVIDVQWGATEIQSPLEYTILVRLDPNNDIRESDKTNNEVVTKVTFVQPPTAVLDNLVISADPTKVEDGEKVTITVSIDNTGDDPAIITITIKDGLTEVGSKPGITVPAGGSKSETFSLKLEGTGDHEITATVYEGSEVAQDPAGNDLIESVTVEVTAKDDGGSNTMLYVVIALIALVVVIALVFFMRRK